MGPVIGITSIPRKVRNPMSDLPHETLPELYLDAVRRVGGMPVIVPVHAAPGPEVLARLDALVLSGGGDVDPRHYGEQETAARDVDAMRDAVELSLTVAALQDGVPLLGICRGMQVMNVALGGTLIADLGAQPGCDHWDIGAWDKATQPVTVASGSLLGRVCGTAFRVNSVHHQAIDRVAPGVTPVAWSADDVIEAVEIESRPFALGVQWHPECLSEAPHPQLFAALVEHAERTGERTTHAARP